MKRCAFMQYIACDYNRHISSFVIASVLFILDMNTILFYHNSIVKAKAKYMRIIYE